MVVPAVEQTGGVSAVARFVKDAILSTERFDLKLISLATSAHDPCNVGITRPSTWGRGPTVAYGTWDGIPYVHVGAIAGELEFQRFRARRMLTSMVADCDILQVVCGSPAWANAVCDLGKPVAVQCATRARVERRRRDGNPQGLAGRLRKVLTSVTDRIDNLALRKVDAIQVENPWMFEYAKRLNSGRQVDLRYAPPGIDAKLFCPLSKRPIEDDQYILCVGRLDDPRKNIGLLLESYSRMPKAIQSTVRLVLAGASGPPPSFWQRAETLGLRHRISYVERPKLQALVELYQKALMFALPSDEEGLGVVLLEAMACGVPVVSTLSGGPDGILTDSNDGFLVPIDDAEALADRMTRLCTDPILNIRMGSAGRETIELRYAETVTANVFQDMWDQMLLKSSYYNCRPNFNNASIKDGVPLQKMDIGRQSK